MIAFHRKSSSSIDKDALPQLWLFTDERVADDIILTAVARLPRGSGIIFRHYVTQEPERQKLFKRIRRIAQRKRHILLVGNLAGSIYHEAGGVHISLRHDKKLRRRAHQIITASAHTLGEVTRANRLGADLIFASPVFPTRSHPGARALGRMRFAALTRHAAMPVIALGGMSTKRFRSLVPLGCYGWGAIDALT